MNIFENIDVVSADSRNFPKVLGIEWISDQDHLTNWRELEFNTKNKWTQWKFLTTSSQSNDLLRFLAPFVIRCRLLLKRIWQTQGQTCDAAIAGEINTHVEMTYHCTAIVCLTIEEITKLHVIGDHSEYAFCAVAHSVVTKKNWLTNCKLLYRQIMRRPDKTLHKTKNCVNDRTNSKQIERLLLRKHSIMYQIVFMWSDSTTVLHWLQTPTKTTYVLC